MPGLFLSENQKCPPFFKLKFNLMEFHHVNCIGNWPEVDSLLLVRKNETGFNTVPIVVTSELMRRGYDSSLTLKC